MRALAAKVVFEEFHWKAAMGTLELKNIFGRPIAHVLAGALWLIHPYLKWALASGGYEFTAL